MIALEPAPLVVVRRTRALADEREGSGASVVRRYVRGTGSRRSLAVHLRNCGSRAARSSPTLRRKSASRARTRVFAGELASGKSLGARYYAPWLGRWTTADPLGLQAGLNLYLYGRASPLNFVDPSGTFDVPAVLKEAAEPYVAAGKAVVSGAVRQGELRAAAPDIGAIIDQSVQGQLQAQADAELIGRVAGRQGLSEFEIGNLTRPAPKGEAPPGFLRGFFREMTGEGVREGPARGLPGDVSTGLLADIANTAVRLGETGAETAVTPGEEASDEAAGRFAFNFLKLAANAVGVGEIGAAAKTAQTGAAEVRAGASAAAEIGAAEKGAATGGKKTLYHYTTEAGHSGILSSERLNPSLKALNPKDVRYGDGQYLSDIVPGTKTPAQLSREFLGIPYQGRRFTHYVEIDVSGLSPIQGRPGVYVIPNQTPLNLTGRIVGSGRTIP